MAKFVATALVLVVLAGSALGLDRLVWRHNGGHFENTVGNRWVEVSRDGRFVFREVFRGPNFIELYDASRNVSVRLRPNVCMCRSGSGSGPFQPLYQGRWER